MPKSFSEDLRWRIVFIYKRLQKLCMPSVIQQSKIISCIKLCSIPSTYLKTSVQQKKVYSVVGYLVDLRSQGVLLLRSEAWPLIHWGPHPGQQLVVVQKQQHSECGTQLVTCGGGSTGFLVDTQLITSVRVEGDSLVKSQLTNIWC